MNRKTFMKLLSAAALLLLLFALAGCGSEKVETKQITAFNTPIDITAYGTPRRAFRTPRRPIRASRR